MALDVLSTNHTTGAAGNLVLGPDLTLIASTAFVGSDTRVYRIANIQNQEHFESLKNVCISHKSVLILRSARLWWFGPEACD
jgi:hypothetical protein